MLKLVNYYFQFFLLAIIVLIFLIFYFTHRSRRQHPQSHVFPLTYVVSGLPVTHYCNGDQMQSDAFKKTITQVRQLSSSSQHFSQNQVMINVIKQVTQGRGQLGRIATLIHFKQGVVSISPIDAWAGYAIFMCWWQPLVEVNLLRLPFVNQVVWL